VTRTINRVGVFGCNCIVELGNELFELVAMNGVAVVDAPNVGEHTLVLLDDRVMGTASVEKKAARAMLMPRSTSRFS